MKRITLTFSLLLATAAATPLHAQISAFTYQGRLDLNGAPANGSYDFMFRLLNDPTNGVAAPVIPINPAVLVTNGLFTTGMDFGAENFDGANRWLEINVRTNGGGPFTTLSPRQLLTPTPYAVAANTASNLLGALPASQISGTIPNASLPASPSFSGTVTANNFSGNGANLTNVNAVTLGGLSSSNFWKTTGNAGTMAGTHFLGTTDSQAVEIKVNGNRVARFEPGGNGAPNIIGGAKFNNVAPGTIGATISGGGATNAFGNPFSNSVAGNFGTIGGGIGNSIETNGLFAADAGYSTIAGGEGNTVHGGQHGTISGGSFNNLESVGYGVIAGGALNQIHHDANYSKIGGGYANSIEPGADYSTIAGGLRNAATRIGTAIGGGMGNAASGYGATIAGGGDLPNQGNNARGDWSSIGGGRANTAGEMASTVAGGDNNSNEGAFSTISGGSLNFIRDSASNATIGGGRGNDVEMFANDATISGGFGNKIRLNAHYGTIGGGFGNTVERETDYATIGGGERNQVATNADHSTIGGGRENSVESFVAAGTISGGQINLMQNEANHSVISGGLNNRIGMFAIRSTIAGGYGNRIDPSAVSSSVGGGDFNTVESAAVFATIPGGYGNTATSYSFAAGNRAKATNEGAFVWGDSTDADIGSTSSNSVTMRASGGYRLFTDSTATTGAFLAAGSGSWTSMSDRNAKENFRATDAREVLEKVVALPMQTWNYKSQDANIRHIGPMAQDFKAAFGLGESDTGISNVDADGVALAAIQGLNQKLEESRAENAELKKRFADLEQLVKKITPKTMQP